MNSTALRAIKGGAVLLVMALATGCTSMQNDVDALKTRVDLLEQEIADAKASATNAASTAKKAQSTADEALAGAAEGIACRDATNEKIDRMFQPHQSK